MEQPSNSNFISVPVRSVGSANMRSGVTQQQHRHHSSISGSSHVKNQHSYSSQHQQSQAHSQNNNTQGWGVRATQNSNLPSAQKSSQNGSSNKKTAHGRSGRRVSSSMSKDFAAPHVGTVSNNGLQPLSLENSFKQVAQANHNNVLMMGQQSQTAAQQSLQSYKMRSGGQENASKSGNQNLLVTEAVGGDGLSPINGPEISPQKSKQSMSGEQSSSTAKKDTLSSIEEQRRQQMRQMKNLQKLQKSGQSRKKSSQFGKSNKILLMSGTKSKMMELSVAAKGANIDKSMTQVSGAIPQGTATLIELGRVNAIASDLMNTNGPQGASQTYNDASKLIASANENEASDYGGNAHGNNTRNQNQQLMMTLSEENDLQAPDGAPMISVFDQLEEMQFMSYELGTKLRSLVDTILQHSTSGANYMSGDGLIVQTDTWDSIQNVAKEASGDFEIIQDSLRSFFDRMQDEVTKWKQRCSKLQTKLQSTAVPRDQTMPPKPMGISKSQGRHTKNTTQNNKSGRITITGNGGRKGLYKQSNSLNHSGIQSKKERLMLEKSLIEIVNVYDKNRTQIYSNLEEMENRVNDFKNTREKLNVQHLGTMTTVEQEMEQLCLRSARSQKSGQALKSHRSHSASKRPMNSLDASRRSSRPDADLPSQKKGADGREVILNTPQIMTSGSKQKPKAGSSGVRSPVRGGRAHSLVPPLPIHMISNLSKDQPNMKSKKPGQYQQQNSARSAHSRPPPPESYRSQRSQNRRNAQQNQLSGRQDSQRSANDGNAPVSRRSAHKTAAQDSMANSSQQNITGAIVNGALVNGVMLGAIDKIGTSKFDKGLEADFSGDEASLIFDTERLKQFPEDFACYDAMDSTDKKILVKQWLFMKYERELKIQAKNEKAVKEQKRQERKAQEQAEGGNPKKRRQNSHGNGSAFNNSNRSSRSGRQQNNNSKDVQIGQMLDISAIQLDSSLSEIGTIDRLRNKAKEFNLEAQLSDMMAVSQNISGLKTVTQKDLVNLAEQHWQAYEDLKKENRKVLEWSNNGDEEQDISLQEQSHEKILAGLSRDEPNYSGPVSPSQINMQVFIEQRQNGTNKGIDNQEPSPIKPKSSQPPGDSFINDSSLVYDEFEQLTPQQVKVAQGPQMQGSRHPMTNVSAPNKHENAGLVLDPNVNLNVNYNTSHAHDQNGAQNVLNIDDHDPVSAINGVANVTSNSDEESILFQHQKKSLDIITERQSEFSNTMGTFARPSQRSKQSKNHSSNAKQSATRGGQSAIINASQHSLNNSSVHINNSSRQKVNQQSSNRVNNNNNVVQSFVDITDNEIGEESKSFISRKSRQFGGPSAQQNDTSSGMANPAFIPAHVDYQGAGAINDETVQTVNQGLKNRQSAQGPPHHNIDSSAQFTDMAAHTPMQQFGEIASNDSRKQPVVTQSNNQNVTRQQVAYKHLMYELKTNEQVQPIPNQNLRQKQQQVTTDLQQSDSIHSSYVDNSCYIDESIMQSSSVDQGLSSVKKGRRQRNFPHGQAIRGHSSSIDKHGMGNSITTLKRSNSEVYIKDTSMQNEDDALFVPIMYAMEASLSLQQSTEVAKIKIDQSQLNNLTRYLEANNSARRFGNGPDSNGTFQINNTLFTQLQKLFMQHHNQGTGLQDFTAGQNNSLKFSLSKSVDKAAGSQNIAGMVEQPSILKPAGFSITSLLNESLQQPHLQKQTLQMLKHLQGLTNHNLNSAVGLLFSQSSGHQITLGQKKRTLLIGDTRGLSPGTDHNLGQSMLKKTISPLVDQFNNLPLDKAEIKRSLLEGLPKARIERKESQYASVVDQDQSDMSDAKFRSEVIPKGAHKLSNHIQSHARVLSKDAVSSYVHQIKRPATNLSAKMTDSKSSAKGQAFSSAGKQVNSTNVSSANIKTSGKQVNHQMMQRSLLAYQSTDFNPRQEQKSDYVDQSVISHSVLGMPSSSLSMISKSVERSSAVESQSSVSAQSAFQRKLRLKTNKQYKFITERQGQGLKQRPASSMATSALNHSVQHQSSRQGSEGRAATAGSGIVNVSSITAKPTNSQFKLLQFNSAGGKGQNSSVPREKSASSSTNKVQLQSQPQLTKQQQLQLKLQQQSLVQHMSNYGQGSGSGSGSALEGTKGPVLKRINIKKIPASKRGGGASNNVDSSKSQQAGVHIRNLYNQELNHH